MDFSSLQLFKAVADEGGISSAAKKLHRVPSNVTPRIQQLEESLGTTLFVRKNRRLFLSPAGEIFLKYAEQLLDLAGEARAAVAGNEAGGAVGAEARGVPPTATGDPPAPPPLPPLLSRFHEKYPGVRIELTTGIADAL